MIEKIFFTAGIFGVTSGVIGAVGVLMRKDSVQAIAGLSFALCFAIVIVCGVILVWK